MEQNEAESLPAQPVATIARQIKSLRKRKGWTAAQLGEALAKHGVPWDRFIVANLESGRRQTVSVTELLALALVLDVAPVNLLLPVRGGSYMVLPNRMEDASIVRDWIRGRQPLAGTDERTYFAEVPLNELRGQW